MVDNHMSNRKKVEKGQKRLSLNVRSKFGKQTRMHGYTEIVGFRHFVQASPPPSQKSVVILFYRLRCSDSLS
jgi:hypothetical protein